MFNDERINAECGKIYCRGILLTVLTTVIYAFSRTATLFIRENFHSFFTYTEAVILILGIGILLTGAIIFRKGGDERTAYERHSFYERAGKVFIIAVLGTYILTIPFTTEEMLGGFSANQLLLLLEALGCLYLFYAFKTRQINFNYSFIAEDKQIYYRRVFVIIGCLWVGLFVPFILAASLELTLYKSPAGALIIFLAYISSSVVISLEYLFISLVEKTSYDSMSNGHFALGTRIALLALLFPEFCAAVLQSVYVYFVTGDLSDIPGTHESGTVIAVISQWQTSLELLIIPLAGLVVCHLMSQIRRGSFLYTVCRVEMLLLALSALATTLVPVWREALSYESLRFWLINVVPYTDFISFVIILVMSILFIYSLVKELGISRALWAIPAAYAIATAANIFFTSQNMLRAGTYVSYTIKIVSFAFLVIVIWRYHGFKKENDNGIDFI